MKMRLPFAMVLLMQAAFAQPSSPSPSGTNGIWQGPLLFGQGKIRVVFLLSEPSSGGYRGAMINLETGAGSNVDAASVANGRVSLEVKSDNFKFQGTLSPDGGQIQGRFTQGDAAGSLTLVRDSVSRSTIADEYQKSEYMIPMRDGIHLHTIVFAPKSHSEALPFLIERSPYGWDSAAVDINVGLSDLARDGYFLVFQDIRGRYGSEGQFVLQRPVRDPKDARSIDEGTDTYDTI